MQYDGLHNKQYCFVLFHIVTTAPLLKDLYEHITPHYATNWKVIGTLLGLPREALKIIEHDNHDKAVPCSNAMLEKWLDVDSTATWNKLLSALHSPAVPSQAPEKSKYQKVICDQV